MQSRQLIFSPRIPYNLVAESANLADKLREATASGLQFPVWWTILDSNQWPSQCQCDALTN